MDVFGLLTTSSSLFEDESSVSITGALGLSTTSSSLLEAELSEIIAGGLRTFRMAFRS